MFERADASPDDEPVYGIDELSELGGVSRRTVRYYVQRGLLPPPTGTGRGKHYTPRHLAALVRIRDWQQAGVSLDAIKRRLERDSERDGAQVPTAPGSATPRVPQPWLRLPFGPDVEVHVRAGVLSQGQLERLAGVVSAVLGDASEAPSKAEGAGGEASPRRDGGAANDGEGGR